MCVKHKRLLYLVQFLALLFIAQAKAQQNNDLMIDIYVDDFPPYTSKDGQADAISQIVTAAFASQGFNAKINYSPWSEVEKQIDQDNKLSFMWSKTAEHKRKWSYSEPVYINKQVLVVKKRKGVFWRRLDELRQYHIGVTQHHNYGNSFENYRSYLTLSESVSDYLSLKKLVKGQVDAVVLESLQAKYLLSFFPEPVRAQFEVLDHKSVDTSNSYLVCSKQYAKCTYLLQKFNRGLQQLKQTSQYQAIINKVFK